MSRLSAILADALAGLLVAGIVVAASVSGLGLAGGGRVLAVGGLIVVLAVVAGQAIRRRIPPGGR
jgi:hypothetical protein